MRLPSRFALSLVACAALPPAVTLAQEDSAEAPDGTMRQVSNHTGEMAMSQEAGEIEVDDSLRFEPFQQVDEMFGRDDVVYLMRHGPTDWSMRDMKDVAPTDCANQRVMVEEGIEDMRDLGTLMAANGVLPSRIIASQWCRNQQTVEAFLDGVARVDPALAEDMPVTSDAELNLLLSLQGAENTAALAELISSWEGDPERPGPLLLVSHYTNIEEVTQFRVFEGEILVLDPDRDNYVLGYMRLRSAAPDVGHFAEALASPLLDEEQALDMVSRYYAALDAGDEAALGNVLADGWATHGASPSQSDRDAAAFLEDLSGLSDGLTDRTLAIDDVYLADDVITVRGTITGRHTGPLYGIPATGREVTFGHMGVHRIEDGKIVESWQMPDRAALIGQILRQD